MFLIPVQCVNTFTKWLMKESSYNQLINWLNVLSWPEDCFTTLSTWLKMGGAQQTTRASIFVQIHFYCESLLYPIFRSYEKTSNNKERLGHTHTLLPPNKNKFRVYYWNTLTFLERQADSAEFIVVHQKSEVNQTQAKVSDTPHFQSEAKYNL